jgi:hypothetical protein
MVTRGFFDIGATLLSSLQNAQTSWRYASTAVLAHVPASVQYVRWNAEALCDMQHGYVAVSN